MRHPYIINCKSSDCKTHLIESTKLNFKMKIGLRVSKFPCPSSPVGTRASSRNFVIIF